MRSRVQLREVTDGVWCFRQRSYVCCSYAVADRAGLVLVHAGMTSDAAPVLHGLAQLGRTPDEVHTTTSQAVTADQLVGDGEVVAGDCRVVFTPGHTAGHVAYFHEPTGLLFAGDALAVVDGKLRFMARLVTPDLPEARRRWPGSSTCRSASFAPATARHLPPESMSRCARWASGSAARRGRSWANGGP
ncbi:MAG: hypothetical protein QOH91_3160 [Mycobacterium sp.]|jgi:glyoxylase-like metal-dependent hydrolase (beta-lactamase superfamily II)|nr:hypothetical protein [Mycobacterium sp.]